jgi:CDP-2,3-bis-(O-geranylgeranyl)-sn-glycerol synthase
MLIEVIWFMLPAGFANMAPIPAARLLPSWNAPLDCGRSLGGTRIFGDHKTVRGLVIGVAVGALVFLAQEWLWARSEPIRSISVLNYASAPAWLGAWMSFGALVGDLVKSFFKRRLGRKPGAPWFPFDQIDWIVGALALSWPFVALSPAFAGVSIAAALILSLLMKWVGFVLRLGDTAF